MILCGGVEDWDPDSIVARFARFPASHRRANPSYAVIAHRLAATDEEVFHNFAVLCGFFLQLD